MRWIEAVDSDEARHLLKVAWQLVGLMTRTEHLSFRSMNHPGSANTGCTSTASPVDDDSHFASQSALRRACRNGCVSVQPGNIKRSPCCSTRGPPGFKAPTDLIRIFGAIQQLDSEIGN